MTDDKFDSGLNFSKVLFLHINRVAMSNTQDMMDAGVDMLESLLCPYEDADYKKSLETASKNLKNGQMMAQKNAAADYTRLKFRELMQLAERRNLLLDKEGEGVDPGDTEEGYDTPDQ